jgi:RNA polymerase sigma factor (sigma-70 family)
MAHVQLSPVVRQVHKLAGAALAERSDEELLDAFTRCRDESAFAALVGRYSSLVMGVCRRALGHQQDAEDAFQASFLVLARCGGSGRRQGPLAGWLYGVAQRTAMNAKRTLVRQRRNDEKAARPLAAQPAEDITWREVQTLLDDEIQRLPEIYRCVFVLCCLHDQTKAETARQLGLKEGTVASRLAKARALLQQRLKKRGVTLSTLMATLDLARDGTQVGAATIRATASAAVAYTAGACASSTVPASAVALADGVTRTMLFSKIRIMTVLVLLAALLTAGAGLLRPQVTTPQAGAKPAAPKQEGDKLFEVRGRILGSDGKPVKDARVECRLRSEERREKTALAGTKTTDDDGRFHLSFRKGATDRTFVVATAAGLGLDWAEAKGEDLTMKLVKDQAITALVRDLEGKPVKDARLRILRLIVPLEADLATHFAKKELFQDRSHTLDASLLPEALRSASTDGKGRLHLAGLGQERMIEAVIEGPTIAVTRMWVLIRPRPIPALKQVVPVHPADFTHSAAPNRPIVGIVRDRDTKKPLAGATVRSEKLSNHFWYGSRFVTTKTDDAGRFRLVGLPWGRGNWIAVVPAADQPYLGVMVEVPNSFGGDPVTRDVELRRGLWAEGQVTDEATGKSVPDVKVRYVPGIGNPDAIVPNGRLLDPPVPASHDGRFRLPVLPGVGFLAVQASKEYLPVSEQTDVREELATIRSTMHPASQHRVARINPDKKATQVRCDVKLIKGESYRGKLVDPDGKEVTGTWVWKGEGASGGWSGPLKSAQFTLGGFNRKKPRFVSFLHEDRNLVAVLPRPGDGPGEPVVQMHKGGVLTGQIVDADGKPRAGVALQAIFPLGEDPVFHRPDFIRTDAAGRFRVTGLLPRMAYSLYSSDGRSHLGPYRLQAGEAKDIGKVMLKGL